MPMEAGDLATWAAIVVSLTCSVAAWRRATAREEKKAIDEVAKHVGSLETRIATLDVQMRGLPSDAAIDKLSDRLNRLHGDLQHLAGEFSESRKRHDEVTEALRRMNSYLLTKGDCK